MQQGKVRLTGFIDFSLDGLEFYDVAFELLGKVFCSHGCIHLKFTVIKLDSGLKMLKMGSM